MAVTGEALTASELGRLKHVHKALSAGMPKPSFDGIYVTWNDLGQNPETIGDIPFTHEGRFAQSGGFESNPSTWLTLHKYPLAVRGPVAPRVWHDADVIRQWNVNNLNSYWRGRLSRGCGAVHGATVLANDWIMNPSSTRTVSASSELITIGQQERRPGKRSG